MRKHVISVAIGVLMLAVGLALWLGAGDVETPVITLSKLGVVLAVLGALEVAISGFALLNPSTRHRDARL